MCLVCILMIYVDSNSFSNQRMYFNLSFFLFLTCIYHINKFLRGGVWFLILQGVAEQSAYKYIWQYPNPTECHCLVCFWTWFLHTLLMLTEIYAVLIHMFVKLTYLLSNKSGFAPLDNFLVVHHIPVFNHVLFWILLLRLHGNPVCSNANLDNLCGSEIDDEDDSESSTNSTASCPSQACPPPFEYLPAFCFCAVPLLIEYRLKSPGFTDFRPYRSTFEEYLTSGLKLDLDQLDIPSFVWEKGPRLRISLKLFPAYVANNVTISHEFNKSEVQRILHKFTSWNINDSELFGPYELIWITLLDPYKDGTSQKSHFICSFLNQS